MLISLNTDIILPLKKNPAKFVHGTLESRVIPKSFASKVNLKIDVRQKKKS